jgi:hypothetical protein
MYPAEKFLVQNGLRGAVLENMNFMEMLDNWDFYLKNRCGITHGHLDSAWNMFSNYRRKLIDNFNFRSFFNF